MPRRRGFSRSLLSAAVSLTRSRIPSHPPCFPAPVLRLDALLPSAGSGAATVPPLPRYYGGAKTARCPSRRASLPSLGGTTTAPAASLLHVHGRSPVQARTLVCRRPSGSPVMETSSSPRFLGHPFRICPALRPRPGRRASPFRHVRCCPRIVDCEGPSEHSPFEAQSHGFCGRCLRFALRVAPADARLASGCLLCFTGWDWLPTGWLRKVSDVYFIFLLPQAWPGATTIKVRTQRQSG